MYNICPTAMLDDNNLRMKGIFKKTFGLVLLTCIFSNVPTAALAQKVVFPQQKQAGVAALKAEPRKFVLSNSLLEAS